MKLKRRIACVLFLFPGFLLTSSVTSAQDKPSPDFSKQPFVLEKRSIAAKFENDGTSSISVYFRVRVQSQAGVQAFGTIDLPYASATSALRIDFVRVTKPDKRVIQTPMENVLEMPAEITRQAPFYSDLKDQQIAVKGLEVGDTLEVQSQTDTNKPLDPGQFWDNFDFFRAGIVLEETLEVRVPKGRAVQIKSSGVQPNVSEDGNYKLYTWRTENLKVAEKAAEEDNNVPAVQITTFRTWDELANWYRGLFFPQAVPTPEIRAKEAEVTKGAATDEEKIRDIYAYVSTTFRYIGVAMGIGRVQPHMAADILNNDYGDCKDKHTLLAALLAAANIKAYPTLINSENKIDSDVPSPLNFDHVITALPRDKNFLFLDSTAEVAPFGYLIASLRDKKALVVTETGPSSLIQTPADPPFPSFFKFHADGELTDSGTFTGKMRMTMRGDAEFPFRLGLRQVGESQWNDVIQQVSSSYGFAGTVTDVSIVTPPDVTDKPFDIQYSYKRDSYSDWENRRISPPFPPIFLAEPPDGTKLPVKPIDLGSPAEFDYQATVKLPANADPQLPPSIHLQEDFAEYKATYSFSDGRLTVERALIVTKHEVDPSEIDRYRKFWKGVSGDASNLIPMQGGSTSGSQSARDFFSQGQSAFRSRNWPQAIDSFQHAVKEDPQFAQAWMMLGAIHASTGEPDKGIEELRRAIALSPKESYPYQVLAALLNRQNRKDDALLVWRDFEKAAPENADAPRNAAGILLSEKRYSEAVSELQPAIQKHPGNAALLIELGMAYARSGEKDKAPSTFEDALKADASPNNLNTVAYELADDDLQLDDALKYADQAVKGAEALTAKLDFDHPTPADLAVPSYLAAYWDTYGWVQFHLAHLAEAEKYIDASWHLDQRGDTGDHLGQVYEKEGKKKQAIEAYMLALAAGLTPAETRDRLRALAGTQPPFNQVAKSQELQNMRIFSLKLKDKPMKHASATFTMLFTLGSMPEAKFANGDEELRNSASDLVSAKFDVLFPDSGPVQILRQGILDCEPEIQGCNFALIPVRNVTP